MFDDNNNTNNAFLYEGASSSMQNEDMNGMNGNAVKPEEVDENIPKLIFYTRVLNLSLGVCMVVASLLSLLTTDSATTGVLACYVVVFACLLCCFESGLQVVLRTIALNFGFMYEIKDFLSANPAFTGFAVQAAGEAVVNNPQMATQAAQSVFGGGNNGGYSPTPTSNTANI